MPSFTITWRPHHPQLPPRLGTALTGTKHTSPGGADMLGGCGNQRRNKGRSQQDQRTPCGERKRHPAPVVSVWAPEPQRRDLDQATCSLRGACYRGRRRYGSSGPTNEEKGHGDYTWLQSKTDPARLGGQDAVHDVPAALIALSMLRRRFDISCQEPRRARYTCICAWRPSVPSRPLAATLILRNTRRYGPAGSADHLPGAVGVHIEPRHRLASDCTSDATLAIGRRARDLLFNCVDAAAVRKVGRWFQSARRWLT